MKKNKYKYKIVAVLLVMSLFLSNGFAWETTETETNTVTLPRTVVTRQKTPSTVSRVVRPANSMTVYRTPTGKRYHLISTCGGKNSYEVNRYEAIGAGLTPCQKCAKSDMGH